MCRRYASDVSRRLLTRRNALLTLALILWVPGCALACWWQITVALAGDSLADLYSAEWPIFGIFGIVAWWRLIHDEPGAIRLAQAKAAAETPSEAAHERRREDEDEALARYNDYLESLADKGRKSWRQM